MYLLSLNRSFVGFKSFVECFYFLSLSALIWPHSSFLTWINLWLGWKPWLHQPARRRILWTCSQLPSSSRRSHPHSCQPPPATSCVLENVQIDGGTGGPSLLAGWLECILFLCGQPPTRPVGLGAPTHECQQPWECSPGSWILLSQHSGCILHFCGEFRRIESWEFPEMCKEHITYEFPQALI